MGLPILNGLGSRLITGTFFEPGKKGPFELNAPHITILMATCNGAQFLPAQLDSLLRQKHCNWSLMVSDDGSSDATPDILHAFRRAHPGRVTHLLDGPNRGSPAQNFMTLLMRPEVPHGLTALADQDDVWLPEKLSRAVDHLAPLPALLPAIYASESILTDARLRPLAGSKEPNAMPGFRNALVQNLFSGHTTVLNASALAIVQAAGIPQNIAFHDWWLYQLIAGAGGMCLLDPAQTVLYRQHGRNAFGAQRGFVGGMTRLRHLLRDDYAGWLRNHWQALHHAAPYLKPEARDLIRELAEPLRTESRVSQVRRLRLRRSTACGTAALWLAAGLGRL